MPTVSPTSSAAPASPSATASRCVGSPGSCRRAAREPQHGSRLRHQVEQARERQADDVEVVALDARDERGADALDGVAARAALPLAGRDVPVEQRGARRAEVDLGDLDRGVDELAVADEGDPADDLVGAAGQARDELARLGASAGLPRMSPSRATSVSAPRVSARLARPPAPCGARSPRRPRPGRRASPPRRPRRGR